MEGQYYLKWNNHHNTLISVFDSLLGSGKHVDCTLAAEGHELGAHKVVLSACSPYLETLLNKPSEKHPIIIFNDVKYDELKAILEYMYRGEVSVLQEQLAGFLKAAEALQIKGLTDQGGGAGGGSNENDRENENLTNGGKHKINNKPDNSEIPSASENQPQDDSSAMINKRKRYRRSSQDKMSDSQVDSSNSCDTMPLISANKSVGSTPLTPAITKIETDRLSNISASSSTTNQQQQPLPSLVQQQQVVIKEKIEPPEMLLQPKTEYFDDTNNDDEHIEDLTLDDDEEDGAYLARPGPSHGDNQDYNSSWHLGDRPMEESFLAAQDVMGNQNNSQDWLTNGERVKRDHSYVQELGVRCDSCGKAYRQRRHLKRHVLLECGKEPQLQCPYCPYKSLRNTTLSRHLKLKH